MAGRTRAFNAHVMERARWSDDIRCLASPVGGGAVILDRVQQLFLTAWREGKRRPEELAAHAWDVLAGRSAPLPATAERPRAPAPVSTS